MTPHNTPGIGIAIVCALLCGCESVLVLKEPPNVPVFVEKYERPVLNVKTHDVPCILDMINCTDKAVLVVKKFSGSTVPGPVFPVKTIIREECEELVESNFRSVTAAEQAKIELKVETRKVMLVRDGDQFTFSLSLAVMLLNPHHIDKPYFSELYDMTTVGTMTDETLVPSCVYEAVQRIFTKFINDVCADAYLAARLDELTP